MTSEEFIGVWQQYGVRIGEEVFPIKDRYAFCWGWHEEWGGLMFDMGGPQPGIVEVLRVESDDLISVNPKDHADTTVIGKLVRL